MGQRYRATCRWKGDPHRPHPPTGAAQSPRLHLVTSSRPWQATARTHKTSRQPL